MAVLNGQAPSPVTAPWCANGGIFSPLFNLERKKKRKYGSLCGETSGSGFSSHPRPLWGESWWWSPREKPSRAALCCEEEIWGQDKNLFSLCFIRLYLCLCNSSNGRDKTFEFTRRFFWKEWCTYIVWHVGKCAYWLCGGKGWENDKHFYLRRTYGSLLWLSTETRDSVKTVSRTVGTLQLLDVCFPDMTLTLIHASSPFKNTNSRPGCHFPFAELPLTLVHPAVLSCSCVPASSFHLCVYKFSPFHTIFSQKALLFFQNALHACELPNYPTTHLFTHRVGSFWNLSISGKTH